MRTVSRLSAVDCKNPQHVFSLSYTLVRTVFHQPNHPSSLSDSEKGNFVATASPGQVGELWLCVVLAGGQPCSCNVADWCGKQGE